MQANSTMIKNGARSKFDDNVACEDKRAWK